MAKVAAEVSIQEQQEACPKTDEALVEQLRTAKQVSGDVEELVCHEWVEYQVVDSQKSPARYVFCVDYDCFCHRSRRTRVIFP